MSERESYRIEMELDAERELEEIRPFDARSIVRAILELEHEAETETRNRKRLRRPIPGLSVASWEVRVGDFRVLYAVRKDRIVRVLRVILKGRLNLDEAARGSGRE